MFDISKIFSFEHEATVHEEFNTVSPLEPHSYPKAISLFWLAIMIIFLVNLVWICLSQGPKLVDTYTKINNIREAMNDGQYFESLKLHQELHNSYPHDYSSEHNIDIAKNYFICSNLITDSKQQFSYFANGVSFLQNKHLYKKNFIKIIKHVPAEYQNDFISLFDTFCEQYKDQRKNTEKSLDQRLFFVLNEAKYYQLIKGK